MKILTWNINGIRATKLPVSEVFASLDADVICLQETKITRDQLDSRSAIVEGYSAYFNFSQTRAGYSGVATFVRDCATPARAEQGLSGVSLPPGSQSSEVGEYGDQSAFTDDELASLDSEGRAVITEHIVRLAGGAEKSLCIINVYCPRADPEREDRGAYKLRFYELLTLRARALMATGRCVIILGDVNTAHRPIDHCDPGDLTEFSQHPGRQWLDQLLWPLELRLEEAGPDRFVDTFRRQHPSRAQAYTCWNTSTGSRQFNYGTRIDYILADATFTAAALAGCDIMPDFEGSDHCPVKASFSCDWVPASKPPPLATKYMPEFAGTQQKLSNFFRKSLGTKFPPDDNCLAGGGDKKVGDIIESNAKGRERSRQNCTVSGINEVECQSSGKYSHKRPTTCQSNCVSAKRQKTAKSGVAKKQSTLTGFVRTTAGKVSMPSVKNRECGAGPVALNMWPPQSGGHTLRATDGGLPNGCVLSQRDKGRPDVCNSTEIAVTNERGLKTARDTSSARVKTTACDTVTDGGKSGFSDTSTTSVREKPGCVDKGDVKSTANARVEPEFMDRGGVVKSTTNARVEPNVTDREGIANTQSIKTQSSAWKSLLCGPKAAPLCKGHNEPCATRTVKKDSLNKGRQFYCCARGEGPKSNKESRCEYFEWIEKKKTKK